MSATPQSGFDIGPLSWVKAEIEHSLNEARTHLDLLGANPGDAKAARYVATHLHQVTGALSMVGLGAATRFNEEIEKLAATLESDPNARVTAPQRIAVAKSATNTLSTYLDSLMAGEPDRPMMLTSAYVRVNQARGASDASESDLFSPDLAAALPQPEDTVALPKPEMLVEAIKQRRGMYQAGLLKLLRDKDMVSGARDMRNATLAIEALQVTSPTRSFWYAAGGFFDAVAANPADAGALAVQLFGKIDQQIKLLIEGVQKVPEKLFRDILLVIGRSKAQTERVRKIRELYRLDELLAIPEALEQPADEQLKVTLRSLREQVVAQKDNWLKFTGGNRAAIEPYVTQAESLHKLGQQQPNRDIGQLIQALGAVGAHLRKTQSQPSETQSIEVATAYLFLESSLENYFRLTPDFAAQAGGIVARLKGAMTGARLPAIDAGNALMDDMSKRAQERMLMFQVGQEVQVNLTTIEGALDSFFRDPAKVSELNTLPPLFSQVQGALAILELDEAAALNQLLRERVVQFSSGAVKGAGEEAESVAEGVSALGLYIAALQQGTTDARAALLPALVRFGLAVRPADPEKTLVKSPVTSGDVDVGKQKVQALYEDWKQQPEQTATRDQLREAVKELKVDAELVADNKAAQQSADALKAIDATFDPNKTGVTEALSVMAPDKPAEAPTAQVVHLIDAPAAEVDQELLEIFLEEATEVVGTIMENLAAVRTSPLDKEALTTIRRGYHTLKGSGRMVGLTDLGEVAWNCEQVLNKWLKDEKPASPGLIAFIDRSSASFQKWVDALKSQGTTSIDGTEIARAAELLKNNKEPDFADSVVTVEPVVPDAVAEAPAIAAPTEVPAEPPQAPVVPVFPSLDLVTPAPAVDAPSIEFAAESPEPAAAENIFAELPAFEPTLPVVDAAPAADIESEAVEEILPATDATTADHADAVVAPVEPAAGFGQPGQEDDLPGTDAEPDVRVGNILVPHALFNIYLREADTHIATMDNEMSSLEAKPLQPVSHEFMRAAHTLTSSSRTTAFDTIADVAHALEKWLQDAIEFPPEFNAHRLRVTRSAVDALSTMVLGLHTHEPPDARPEVVEALGELRSGLRESKRTGEGTHLKMPLLQGDAAESAPAESAPDASPPAFDPGLAFETVAETPPPLPAVDASVPDAGAPAVDFGFSETLSAPEEPPAAAVAEPAPAFDAALVFGAVSAAGVAAAAGAFAASAESAEPEATPEPVATTPPAPFVAEPPLTAPPAFEAPPVVVPQEEIPPPVVPLPAEPPVVEAVVPAAAPATAEEAPAAGATDARPAAFETGKDRRSMVDDVDQDLLPIFLEEAKEIMPSVGDALRRWRATPANHAPVTELARHLHTLKGSARMAGLMRLGELAHVIEERIIGMDKVPEPAANKFEEVDDGLDRFNAAINRLVAGDFSMQPIEIPIIADVSQDLPTPLAVMAAARAEIIAEGEKLEGRERQSLLRVNADIIDRFVNEAGELSIARSRIDQEMMVFKQSLLELTENVNRMRTQLREIEIQAESQIQSRLKDAEVHGESFDPLEFDRFSRTQELTRFLAESLNDVVTLQLSLQKNIDETEAALLQQSRLNRDLQQGLMGVRLVPLGNLQDRFYRLMRQTAKELDKKANLEFRGTRVEIDRSVLEKITAPFEHLLRNAVAHGLEMPTERLARGKPEIGEISIDAQQVGNEVVLTLADDGAGLNFARIREKAIEKGMLDAAAEVNEAQLTQFIFMPGFSTAETVSQIAGRGVGMDVVRNEIVSLGGRIDIASTTGRGTTFTIALPLTLAVTQAVMVMVGETMYAIPSVMIEQVQEYKGKRYEPFLEMTEIEWKGNKYPLRSMEALLGGKPAVSAQRKAAVILAKSGQQRAAVQVDSIIGNREVVVKTIGPQLARLAGVAGATMTGSGQIVLIMNPVQLVFRETATVSVEKSSEGVAPEMQSAASASEATVEVLPEAPVGQSIAEAIAAAAPEAAAAPVVLKRTVPLVMVVDDSLTVRKITSRMLTREGFEVATAKDGVDGLQQLQDVDPDIILLDIEMPRMDGFEFARNVRLDAKTKGIPIIMITSRTADKHRNHAIEIGVNEYMGKPYQEEQLLAMIRQYTRHITAA